MQKILTIISIVISISCTAQESLILTNNGVVQGSSNSDGSVQMYKGIPFAAPPIGNLRWQAPQSVINWVDTLDCTKFRASPIQNSPQPFYAWSSEFIAKPEPLSEDCLHLNIWSPKESKTNKVPVFVWIYGGGLNSGSANCDIYDGEEMAKQGIVFVSLNYRVGVLGFMAHPELSEESPNYVSGNYGFLDQIAALEWIQKNIAAFGGDPENVTIAGQSAGAFSVTAMIASPLARGLFHKAIAQSGGLLSNRKMQTLTEAENQGVNFMEVSNARSIAELRDIPAEELQKISTGPDLGRFGTTLDDFVLPKDLEDHFAKGKQNQTPILTGWVTGDGSIFGETDMSVEGFEKEASEKYGDQAGQFLQIFPVSNSKEVRNAKQKLALLDFAGLPSHLLAIYNSKNTYLYEFGYSPPAKAGFRDYGAFHTSEVPFVLHTLHLWDRSWTQKDRDLERVMSSFWVNFAKTGNPNGDGLPLWKSYDKVSGNIMLLGDDSHSQAAFMKKEFDFLEKN